MGLRTSFGLGTTGILALLTGVHASDLRPSTVAPVDFVRVCSTYGKGFFTIPGSDTCLRVSGYVRADAMVRERIDPVQDVVGYRSRARVNFDTRTPTEYGPLRAFMRLEFRRDTGPFTSVFSEEDDETLGQPIGGEIENEITSPDVAYVQFVGFTAGRIQSFYDFYTNDLNFEDIRGSDTKLQVFAYTATFGEGFSATISLEDSAERRFSGRPFGGFPVPVAGAPEANALRFAGIRVPDAVANLRTEQKWGDAQLSGAIHEVRPVNVVPAFVGLDNRFSDTEYGFAAQAGVRLNLPFLAEGDELWMQAGYARGAPSYLNLAEFTQVGGVLVNGVDGFVDPAGQVRLSEGYALSSAFVHYWTPQIRQGVFGSYARLEFAGAGQAAVVNPFFGPINVGFVDFSEWRLGTNLIWSPVKGLDLGAEAMYVKLDPDGDVLSAPVVRGPLGFEQRRIDSDDVWIGRVRVQREF